jgi:hypothetical protein
VTIILEPDTEKRDTEIPIQLRRALGAKLSEKLKRLSFSHKKEFVVRYSEAKKTRARRVEKMKTMLSSGNVISKNLLLFYAASAPTLQCAPSESTNCASTPPKSCFLGGMLNSTPLALMSR